MRSCLFVFLIACGGGRPSTTPPVNQPQSQPETIKAAEPMAASPGQRPTCGTTPQCALETFTWFKDRVCSCQDKACAEKVTAEISTWGQEMAQSPGAKDKAPPEIATKMTEVGQQFGECLTKIYTQDQTSPPDPCGGANPCGD